MSILIESMVKAVIGNMDPVSAVDIATGGDVQVRTFFDGGMLCIATMDDVMIDPAMDSRVEQIAVMVNGNDWPSGHPIIDVLEGYEGSLSDLHGQVLKMTNQSDDIGWN